MKEIKKEDDEVSINPQGNPVKMVNKVGGRNPTFEGITEELNCHIFDCSDAR